MVLKDFITSNATGSTRANAVGFLKQDDPSADVPSVRKTLIELFASNFEDCLISEIDIDEELKRNEKISRILSDITEWNWIYGKAPRFWFDNGHVNQYVEGGFIKQCSLGHIGKKFEPAEV